MPKYIAYPTVKDIPNRKARKSKRKQVFWANKYLAALERKERKIKKEKENVS